MINNKIQGLNFLSKNSKKIGFRVPKFIYIKKRKFNKNPKLEINKIRNNFKKYIIIRSSAKDEDNYKKTNAGKYLSKVSNIEDINLLEKNIREVLSYLSNKDSIIVQDYLKNVNIAGVIFTRDHNTGGPYYIINYDKTGKTNLITSGQKNPLIRTSVIHHSLNSQPEKFKKLIKIIKKIILILKKDKLDLEFAIKKNQIYLFQIRHLRIISKNLDKEIDQALFNFDKKLEKIFKSSFDKGSSTILSNMTDWNPAEMIGKKPSNLSMSLYKELITDSVWAEQRNNYGYNDVRPDKLMFNLLGSPYIDVKTDFKSFIPKNITKNKTDIIVSKYLKVLKKDISNHDKVEFNVIETCYSLNTENRIKKININFKIYKDELKKITKEILLNEKKFIENELKNIKTIDIEINNLRKSKLSLIEKIYFAIDKCKKIGTLSFSGIARIAFIYTKILRDLRDKNIITIDTYNNFFSSLRLISSNILELANKAKSNKRYKYKFNNLYGHIRPSTYSIDIKNYKQNFESYFKSITYNKTDTKLNISRLEKNNLNKNLKKINNKLNANIFIKNAKKIIEAREFSKNEFTKFIDFVFECMIGLSKEMNIDKKQLKFINIKTLLSQYENLSISKLKKILLQEIKNSSKDYEILSQTKLPDVITNQKDIYYYEIERSIPTYVTKKTITGQIINLKKNINFNLLKNKIIIIENADPGYDFIFSYNIKGLITKYGGSNSHMAIRCQENDIPAIIGCGELDYDNIISKKSIQIDCKNNFYKIIY